jgi:hypothetical protein
VRHGNQGVPVEAQVETANFIVQSGKEKSPDRSGLAVTKLLRVLPRRESMENKANISELIVAEQVAKREWEQAIQVVRIANENVGKAHAKWLAASNAVTVAQQNGIAKSRLVKAAAS